MYTISTNLSAKNIIKNIIYKLNEQQYFQIETETETETDDHHIFEPWTRDAPTPEGGGIWNIGLLVQCRGILWEGSKIGSAAAASWAVIWMSGNNEPKIPASICSLSLPWIRLVRRIFILALLENYTRHVVETWMWDAPPHDGNIWILRRLWAKKGLLQSPICWWGWWQAYGISAKLGHIWRTGTASIPDWTLRGSENFFTGRRTVGAKILHCWLGRRWFR